jgi:hypothetical protein
LPYDNLARASDLLSGLANEISAINTSFTNNAVPANLPYNPQIAENARMAAGYIDKYLKAISPALNAATELSKTIDKIKKNTDDRQKSHRDVQRLAQGTDLSQLKTVDPR